MITDVIYWILKTYKKSKATISIASFHHIYRRKLGGHSYQYKPHTIKITEESSEGTHKNAKLFHDSFPWQN